MMTCQQCQDLLLLYVTGALEPSELTEVRAHLAGGCPACAGALAAAEATLHKIPLGLPLKPAPASAWEALETRIALKEQVDPGPNAADRVALVAPFTPRRSSPMAWTGWAVAAAVAIALGIGLKSISDQLGRSQSEMGRLTAQVNDLQTQLKSSSQQNSMQLALYQSQANDLQNKIDILIHSDQYAVAGTPEQPNGSGRLFWNKAKKTWDIYLDGVKPAGGGKTYELWIITTDGQKLAAGVATPDASGKLYLNASVNVDPAKIAVAAFTDEPSLLQAPTGQVQFAAKLN
ncbi:MAG TPA: anti-sigma factor [Phycisphaerae bacterium]|jgi:hypothetical protein